MKRRMAIIEMLATHRAKGDVEEYEKIRKDLNKLSTGLLTWMLDENELAKLKEMEIETETEHDNPIN
jgi:hypothetical protein